MASSSGAVGPGESPRSGASPEEKASSSGAGNGPEADFKAKVREEMTAAMRARDRVRLGTLRLLSAAITNREKDLRRELSADEVREVAAREVKKRNESIEAFDAAGRTDLADRERAEREILRSFAPEQLDEAAIDAMIDEAIASTGATSSKEMGKVMGVVMGKAKGRVDGAVVQRIVRARLNG